ncbi:hydroxymethylpyrimidine/phosphomethylpyrimidine kinase [Mesorhizobium retamae]|uniref:hydroxymethylpyrimidine kinase n=1 Tax=Mesorhizobium retamae TaxID=2912854 RepID=A0ABS9QDI3_9HYPH|nr:hydroxymethylpyrimidine/phosphomethylpyrimidine kinase [Mesorhizobium sp. IRAMC:0171]MCG7505477.1 hydroxymethylpyrimidine/phosphomethylpyrimidine kinase [Mesorhizobium sp. IRAMC:0171]
MAMMPDRQVLIVAGSDSSGGAGIARDVETVAAFGLRACLAVTAVTVQTHDAVERVEQMPADLIAAQMRAAFASNAIAAVKIGMLGTSDAINAVASVLASRLPLPVVLDPVLASTSGRALLAMDAVEVLKRRLMPLCTLVTPNLPELALLSGKPAAVDEAGIIDQAGPLLEGGAPALLVKGGHAEGDRSVDLFLRIGAKPSRFEAPRLDARLRGTGCMLASATAAGLALGGDLEAAIGKAKDHVFEKLRRAMRQGFPSPSEGEGEASRCAITQEMGQGRRGGPL